MISTVSELLAVIGSKDPSSLHSGLIVLRKQWSFQELEKIDKITEDMPPYTALLRYAHSQSDLSHFFEALKPLYQMATSDTTQVFIQVLTLTLEILAKSSLKGLACKASRVLVKDHIKLFYRLLSSGHNAIVSPTLDLLTTIASIDGSLNELLFTSFDFGLKSLPKFAFMRKKTLAQGERRDIRSAYIHFLMSFVAQGNMATKQSLAKLQNLVGPIFTGLPEDQPALITYVLDTVRTGILYNEKKSKALIIAFMYTSSLHKIAKLLDSDNEELIEAADSFLRLICTSSENGLVFKSITDDMSSKPSSLKNKIILDFLLSINPMDSLKKQEFFLDVMQACPDIFGPYWSKSTFSFDAEASARYINLVSFTVKALTTVPLVANCDINEIMPKGVNAANMGRSLSHANALVSYYGTLLLQAICSRAQKLVSEIECRIAIQIDTEALCVSRNNLVEKLAERLPTLRIIKQAFDQIIKTKAQLPSTFFILDNILNASSILSELFAFIPERLIPIISYPFNLPTECRNSAWNYIIVTGSFNIVDIPKILIEIKDMDMFVQPLMKSVLNKSGFVKEVVEVEFLLHKIGQLGAEFAEALSSSIIVFTKKQFLSTTLVYELGLQSEFEVFVALKKPRVVKIDNRHLQGLARHEESNVDQNDDFLGEIPVLSGSSLSALVSEVMTLAKLDRVNRAISSSDFSKEFSSIPKTTSAAETSQLLLQKYDHCAWLQFLGNCFAGKLSNIDLRLFIETGVIGFAIHGLGSSDQQTWRASHHVMKMFYDLLLAASFRERREVLLVIDCLRNSLNETTILPQVIATFLCESLQVLLRPAHFMYAKLMEFYLGNHSLDLQRIPLVTDCLHSHTETMGREQAWMLRILGSSVKPNVPFNEIFQYNHVIDMVETILQLPYLDFEVERLASKLLAKLSKIDPAYVQELASNHGLRAWISSLPESRKQMLDDLSLALS